MNAPQGRLEQSAEQASYDSWIKYYRPDENSANSSISYYNKGELLGWMLDIEIRQRTSGRKSLDDVMRGLFQDYAQRGVGFPDADLKGVFEKVSGANLTDFFDRYVKGTSEIDFEHYLQAAGLHLDRTYEGTQGEANIALPDPGSEGSIQNCLWNARLNDSRFRRSRLCGFSTGRHGGVPGRHQRRRRDRRDRWPAHRCRQSEAAP
jgi:hypothetical protein